ncbi:MAG: Glu-tRNA(Gln) amidotransferase subunit GatD [Methanomicrobiales archaeon]|nr:Glu-tRNA(Gln) amidotransferase subunit GatD [Methanomicrobiales archaeon]
MTDTAGLQSGDQVRCRYAGTDLAGTFITRRDGYAVVKLESGYNIGIPEDAITATAAASAAAPVMPPVPQNPDLPSVAIISTGGTIASRIDYRTGAVTSQFSADDILRAIPGLTGIASFRSRQLATILSENMQPALWQELARAIHAEIRSGAGGVIVTHGTDTMSYSAAAVSFMLETPVPVVFVGSQRSADRPSSDNVMNGMCAAQAAISDLGEVCVVMHASTSDDRCAIHRGTRVRKMHTSRRDAFASIGMAPLGTVAYPSLDVTLSPGAVRRGTTEPALHDALDDRVGMVTFYPGMDPAVIDGFAGYQGLVVSGTGLGHVSAGCIRQLAALVRDGTAVVMTSQCLNGRVCDRVYDTGRDLLAAGVIEGEDMLPEVAMTKLMWVLGRTDDPDEVRDLMRTSLRGELGRCSAHGL